MHVTVAAWRCVATSVVLSTVLQALMPCCCSAYDVQKGSDVKQNRAHAIARVVTLSHVRGFAVML